MTQSIRLSQFVLTYGPGAILEGANGPRLIPDSIEGLFYNGSPFIPEDYRIDDDRMSIGLLQGANIYRLPSNDEVGYTSDQHIFRTKAFPTWKLCLNQGNHNGAYLLYQGPRCPVCQTPGRGGQQEAIRFVVACPAGHLDEVPWDYLVHRGTRCAQTNMQNLHPNLHRSDSLYWNRRGGTLSSIEIECPRCGRRRNFGDAYYRDMNCSGRHPQREPLGSPAMRTRRCQRNARIIQRQAANLRVSEIRTLLSIKSMLTSIHTLLQNPTIKAPFVAGQFPASQEEFRRILQSLVDGRLLRQNIMDELMQSPWNETQLALRDVLSPVPTSYHDLIVDEFKELFQASINGAPPTHSPPPRSRILFEVDPNTIENFDGPMGTRFRITPIKTLRTITVQTGFRREISETRNQQNLPPQEVSVSFRDMANRQWYPGVEFLGEGLFIRFEEGDTWEEKMKGKSVSKWKEGFMNPDSYGDFVFRDSQQSREELHPLFVWWHTLSHLLIRSISEHAGYSSTAIRERIYLYEEKSKLRGGILLYATQPGSEGTMGGLTALAPFFDDIFRITFEQLQTCSGDPLCLEQEFQNGMYNGAACYGCTMVSETSCEHRNMWLDRHILLDNMP